MHRGRRLRELADMQTALYEALAAGDAEQASRAREALERLELLHGLQPREARRTSI